jgi:hypothetical protein
VRCQRCGCSHPPFAEGEIGSFNPDCRCNCHGIQTTCSNNSVVINNSGAVRTTPEIDYHIQP